MGKYKLCKKKEISKKGNKEMSDEQMVGKLQGMGSAQSSQEMRSNLEQSFMDAVARIKTRTSTPSNGDLLILYGLYKQVTEGDCETAQPWAVQVQARAKWEAWNKNKKMDKFTAMRNYIDKVEELMCLLVS
jgi:diazepam-binding inhibitor (GABA receptor modulating acyl-CoA-binding protein)